MQGSANIQTFPLSQERLPPATDIGDACIVQRIQNRLHRIPYAAQNRHIAKLRQARACLRGKHKAVAHLQNSIRKPAGFPLRRLIFVGPEDSQNFYRRLHFLVKHALRQQLPLINAVRCIQQRLHRLQNCLSAAEVLQNFHRVPGRLRYLVTILAKNLRSRMTEPINRLVRITHRKKLILVPQQRHQVGLLFVDVLILIQHDLPELFPNPFTNVSILPKQLDPPPLQIIKIQSAHFRLATTVEFVEVFEHIEHQRA